MIKGKITRISGPVIYAEGLGNCGLYDVVDVGKKKIIGEIIRQNKEHATIQVYEDDTGMKIGEEVVSASRPLLSLPPWEIPYSSNSFQEFQTMFYGKCPHI